MIRYTCEKCRDTGLVTSPIAAGVCIAAAVAYCVGSYFILRGLPENPPVRVPYGYGPGVLLALLVFGPPVGLILLAKSSVFKRGCPSCGK